MFKKVYQKFGIFFILMILLNWIVTFPSPFQQGGISTTFYWFLICFVIFISILIALLDKRFSLIESYIAGFNFGVISLFLTSLFIAPPVMRELYGNEMWFLWDKGDRIIANAIFYGSHFVLTVLLIQLYHMIAGLNAKYVKRKNK